MSERYDAATHRWWRFSRQVALVGSDEDGDGEFDQPPILVDVGEDSFLWRTDFTWGDVTAFEHTCPDGRRITGWQVVVLADRGIGLLFPFAVRTTTHVLRVCAIDCGGTPAPGRPLPAGLTPGIDLLP